MEAPTMAFARANPTVSVPDSAAADRRRVLGVACCAHALHDGYTDLIYVLLPIWQTEFAISYAALGALRMLYTGAMAGLQMPSALLAARFGARSVLALGKALAACAYMTIGLSGAGFVLLAAALLAGGAGSSTQHPLASGMIAGAYEGPGARAALGTYNFAGDLGKMAVPATLAWLIVLMPWRSALGLIGLCGLAVAAAVCLIAPRDRTAAPAQKQHADPIAVSRPRFRMAFPLLLSIGVLDSGTRMGFLAFLPFILREKGASAPGIGLALTLVFAGGAAGKLACGLAGAKFGVLRTVLLTEFVTAAGIVLLAWLPLDLALASLVPIGIALNGTSSVLYGTVPELVSPDRRDRAFSLFYTGTIGAGAIAPVLYGLVGDAIGPANASLAVAGICLLTLPLALLLAPALRDR
jgi:MFS transporter, FSR family, fosmidomycin resistance protein